MSEMPILETPRLLVRPFVIKDLADVHRLFDVELHHADLRTERLDTLAERAQWLQWAMLNYAQLAKLHQPPYGDRAVVLKPTRELVGSCGFVPCLNAFEQLPGFSAGGTPAGPGRYSTEFGLFYAISPAHRRRGYASEAAQVLVDYAFQHLHLLCHPLCRYSPGDGIKKVDKSCGESIIAPRPGGGIGIRGRLRACAFLGVLVRIQSGASRGRAFCPFFHWS